MRHDLDPTDDEEIGAAIRRIAASVDAPDGLRRRVAADGGALRRPIARRRLVIGLAAAGIGATAGIGVFWAAGRGPSGPTLGRVAAAALSPPDGPAPEPDPTDREYLTTRVGDVRFPSYAGLPNWRVVGSRSERLSGRRAVTVIYTAARTRIGYTVIDGPPLAVPAGVTRVRSGATDAAILRVATGSAVTWRSGGHTCLLASPDSPAARLLRLIPAPS